MLIKQNTYKSMSEVQYISYRFVPITLAQFAADTTVTPILKLSEQTTNAANKNQFPFAVLVSDFSLLI